MNAIVMPRRTSTERTREEADGTVNVGAVATGATRVEDRSAMVIHHRSIEASLCSLFVREQILIGRGLTKGGRIPRRCAPGSKGSEVLLCLRDALLYLRQCRFRGRDGGR